MTVAELKALLADVPEDLEVVVLADQVRPVAFGRVERFSELHPADFMLHAEGES